MPIIQDKACGADPCLWVRDRPQGLTLAAVVVDDMIVATNESPKTLHRELSERFETKDLGPCEWCLGLEVTRDRPARRIYLSQQTSREKVLRAFRMDGDDVKTQDTPLPPGIKLSDSECVDYGDRKPPFPYRELLGSIMYMTATRPDIQYAVSVLARFCKGPSQKHWRLLKGLLRYIKGTTGIRLELGGRRAFLWGESDTDWKGESAKPTDEHRSRSGGRGCCGDGSVAWHSTLQKRTGCPPRRRSWQELQTSRSATGSHT